MKAKDLIVEKWLNSSPDFKVELADGKIKFIHVFQMLCPGCVYYGIPQTIEVFEKYNSGKFSVLGLHSVFENHEVMNEAALKVFIKEWRLNMPIGIDKKIPDDWMPATMRSYALQGTPSILIIDGKGELRMNYFGHLENEQLFKFLDSLIKENLSAIELKT